MRRSAVRAGRWVLATVLFAGAATAWGHGGEPPDLNFYGSNFNHSTAACQRMLGLATGACFHNVLSAQRVCMEAQMAGGTCDVSARDAAVEAAKQTARDRIAAVCNEVELGIMQFNSLEDASADVAAACDAQAAAALSLAYGPVSNGGVASLPSGSEACMALVSRETGRIINWAARDQAHSLNSIASRHMSLASKQIRMARATLRISRIRQQATQRIQSQCGDLFSQLYNKPLTDFLDQTESRADCLIAAGYIQNAVTCPAPVCGNGVKEPTEECDDGNTVDSDGCHNNCTKSNCDFFPTTYDLIQTAIFEHKGCTNDLCHGSTRSGGLDLRAGVSYDNIVDAPSLASALKRVEPGEQELSLLWLKLAAKTLGRQGVPGSPMPADPQPALSADELEAMRIWIHEGAPRTGVVAGVAGLLDACAPPPDPIQIRPPAPPAFGTGVQMRMPQYPLPKQSETEVCFASYYDFTGPGVVPQQFRGPSGDTFRYRRHVITQDPLSHHIIVSLYLGSKSWTDLSWGDFTCKGGPNPGQACDPTQAGACGDEGECGSPPVRSVACIGFGPFDFQTSAPNFTGTQKAVDDIVYADGVYAELPLKGIVVWNSHAFNLTDQDSAMHAWINFDFASDQRYPVQGIFDTSQIFVENVPPFQQREYCNTHVLPQGARLFELSSHMHKRGKRFTIFNPAGDLIYTSLVYNDPVKLRYDPPLAFDDADPATRTFKYCALYDNGFTNPADVKRASTTPPNALFTCVPSHCAEGLIGQACSGIGQATRDHSCDSSPGAGDGRCDACTLTGGVSTEDEMFILLGSFYMQR